MKVLYFASARDAAGQGEDTINLSSFSAKGQHPTLDDLLGHVQTIHDRLRPIIKTSLVSLNSEYVLKGSSVKLNDSDEVAIIPQVSGG
ncbi:Molybdopterin synthase sulfur carrier subunit [Coemansia reversa NRRL 1564]|uniref:Molybdopterin synthase sulfur carrier subunit n=1 Tax=Coemansia reversa (strain ATCC 12441 / NRRL 1564) TaxID=763665 RepID=A0A2G5B4T3_COERN|nr:Molybdopterin synthase sulfur carrier subunit [Coemansia reversa NRRL 1564]|eukprot:PIA14015.1 Molybdopterin synthase sulfur carrier subunit [Coemansia reversa NRRL 1564]